MIAQTHLTVTLYIHWSILLVSEHIIILFYWVPEHGTCCIESQLPQGHYMRADMLRDTICITPSTICYWYSFRLAFILHSKIITNLIKSFTSYFQALKEHATPLHPPTQTKSAVWKVLKCGAGEGWRRSVGPIMWEMKKCYLESMIRGIFYMK